MASASSLKFRPDINALRALAVTAVVLFHYKVNFVPGGFAGVDVFFVISGYLMTAIITGRLTKGRFSLWEFYGDRAKRIVPGLLGMCAILLAAGYFTMDPLTYQDLSSACVSALLFISNFDFWNIEAFKSTGYFDVKNNTQWLLHTWSLSVEWQFYLLYPFFFLTLRKLSKTRQIEVPVLWALLLLSLLACVWLSAVRPVSAFYLLPQRAWELLAGGIVALQFGTYRWKRPTAVILAGFSLIAISVLLFNKFMVWPSYFAILPVLGTCLIIAANKPEAAVFQNPLVQTIGKWSYSVYLWHWPVAVAAVYFGFTRTTPLKVAIEILIVLAILSSWALISYGYREFAQGRSLLAVRPRRAGAVGIFAATVACAAILALNDGLADRHPAGEKSLQSYRSAASDWTFPGECLGLGPDGNVRPCHTGTNQDRQTLVIGDSFAAQIWSRFVDYAKQNPQLSFTFLAAPGHPPMTGVSIVNDRFHSNGYFEKAFQYAKEHYFPRIILVSNWHAYFHAGDAVACIMIGAECRVNPDPAAYLRDLDAAFAGFRGELQELRDKGSEFVVIGPTPWNDWNIPMELLKREFWGTGTGDIAYIDRPQFEAVASPVKARLAALAKSLGATYIDPAEFLCDKAGCPTLDNEGQSLFMDQTHYRAAAVTTSRFRFLDAAAGMNDHLRSASISMPSAP